VRGEDLNINAQVCGEWPSSAAWVAFQNPANTSSSPGVRGARSDENVCEREVFDVACANLIFEFQVAGKGKLVSWLHWLGCWFYLGFGRSSCRSGGGFL